MTDLATLVVKLEAETSKYSAALDASQKKLESFHKDVGDHVKELAVQIAEVLAVRELVEFTSRVIEAEAHLAELAKQTGVATDELSKLQFAAKLEGVDDLSTAFTKLSVSSQQALAGNKQLLGVFGAIGISVDDLKKSSPDQLLLKVADGFAKYADGAAKITVARELIGKSGAQLIAFLDQGSDAIKRQGDELQILGGVVTPEAAAASKEYEDNLIKLKAALTGIVQQALIVIVPLLKGYTENALDAAKNTNTLSESVQTLVTGFKLFVAGVDTVVTSLVVIGKTIGGVGAVVDSTFENMAKHSEDLARGDLTGLGVAFVRSLIDSRGTAKIAVDDIANTVESATTRIGKLWVDTGTAVNQEIKDLGNSIRDQPLKPVIELPNTEAIQAIQSAIAGLKQKAADIDLSSGLKSTNLAAAQAAISVGSLAQKVKDAGVLGAPFVRQYLDAAVVLDKVQASAGVIKLTDNLKQQIATFQLGKVAALEYTLTQGQLGAQIRELVAKSPELRAQIKELFSDARIQEVQSYQDQIKQIDIQILNLQGHTAEAAAAQLELQQRILEAQATETKDQGGQALLDKLELQRQYNKAVSESAQILKDINDIRSLEAAQEEVINAAIASGSKDQEAGAAQISDLRKAELAQLDALIAKYDLLAASSGKNIPQIQIQAKQLDASLKTLDASVDLLAKKLRTDFISSASDAFTSFVTGSQTASQAIHSFLTSIESELIKLATNKALESLFGASTTGSGGIFGMLAGLFSGGGSPAGGAAGAYVAGQGGVPIDAFFASGGDAKAGHKYEVGELGPEEFVPDTNGKIEPHSDMKQDININFTIQAPAGTVSRSTQQQIAAATQMGISRASRRNN